MLYWVFIIGIVFVFCMFLRIVFSGNPLADLQFLVFGLVVLLFIGLFAAYCDTEDEKYRNIAITILLSAIVIFFAIRAIMVF